MRLSPIPGLQLLSCGHHVGCFILCIYKCVSEQESEEFTPQRVLRCLRGVGVLVARPKFAFPTPEKDKEQKSGQAVSC